jgi:hypothetical protein
MNQGHCLCGTVRYEVDGPFETMMNCHCSMCRKHHGAPFATFVGAPLAGFRWISGQDAIETFKTESGSSRSFCGTCGSVTPMLLEAAGVALCPAGTLEGELGIKLQSHLFAGSKAPWYDITDALPQYEAFPPEWGMPGVERPQVEQREGFIQGSCLCGEIAFEIEGNAERLFYCHCSRCRQARSAAHGANLFFKAEQLHWLRGESLVKSYKDPNARFFGVSFCSKCGSGAPRVNRDSRMAYAPAGMLDTDPGIRPVRIFVGSKAPWLELTDDAPRFEEMPPRPGA